MASVTEELNYFILFYEFKFKNRYLIYWKTLSMFGTTWVYDSFSTIHFMTSKWKENIHENLAY